MSSQCSRGTGEVTSRDLTTAKPDIFKLKKGNGTASATNPAPGYTHIQ